MVEVLEGGVGGVGLRRGVTGGGGLGEGLEVKAGVLEVRGGCCWWRKSEGGGVLEVRVGEGCCWSWSSRTKGDWGLIVEV